MAALLGLSACGGSSDRYVRSEVPPPVPASPRTVVARSDPALRARVASTRPLLYAGGADTATGRPEHVRAGSAMVWFGRRLAVIQDDALFVALVEPENARVSALVLPAGHGGARLFDDTLGNKAHKLDLEAAVLLDKHLYAFGSGSTEARELVVVLKDLAAPPQVIPARRLYGALRQATEFSGSELNIEGAAVVGDELVLFQRGNGQPRAGVLPVDATVRLDVRDLVRYLDSGDASAPPALGEITRYELGSMAGVRLTFTDATALGDRLFYLAAAEDSPDVVRDGAVAGTALGVIEPDGTVRSTELRGPDGQVFSGKAEGIALDPSDPKRAYIVIDADDPDVPAALCGIDLEGF